MRGRQAALCPCSRVCEVANQSYAQFLYCVFEDGIGWEREKPNEVIFVSKYGRVTFRSVRDASRIFVIPLF
jgi:hypothetical protein